MISLLMLRISRQNHRDLPVNEMSFIQYERWGLFISHWQRHKRRSSGTVRNGRCDFSLFEKIQVVGIWDCGWNSWVGFQPWRTVSKSSWKDYRIIRRDLSFNEKDKRTQWSVVSKFDSPFHLPPWNLESVEQSVWLKLCSLVFRMV